MANQKATNINPVAIIPVTAVSTLTPVTSLNQKVYGVDNVTLQCKWTGTLAGTFDVQTNSNSITDPIDWDSLSFSPTPQATGSANHGTIEINQNGGYWIRVVFTPSSGSGNLSVFVMGKGI